MATDDKGQPSGIGTGGLAWDPADVPAFAGSDRLRPDGRPRPEFRAELRRIPNGRNTVLVLAACAMPVGIAWAAVVLANPAAWVVAFIAMGVWFQRAATLYHEASHRLLFSNRRVNDVVGEKLIGWLTFGDGGSSYRLAHSQHHRDEFGPKEPDLLLYGNYPIPRASFRRKLLRDAVGISGWKNLKPAIVGLAKPARRGRALRFWAGQILVFACYALAGVWWAYFVLYLAPWMTFWRVFNRLRALAEHGGMQRSDDRRLTTHHVRQGFLSRYVFLADSIGFHLAHHVDSGVPMANLPKLQRALEEDGYVDDRITYPSYRALWRALVR